MSENLPLITVVIAARPGQSDIQALVASRQLDYPRDRLELIVARGTQPAIQRNVAIRAAQGEWIYFLDDDSRPPADNLRKVAARLSQPMVQMIGGPNLCPPDAPFLEQAFALVMASWLAFFTSRARYHPVGYLRESGEKELILCNLLARRSTLEELGGFDESLYPNEENALMDELRARGGKMLYDPEFWVYRRPRRTLKSFAKMLMTYGRGRAEQFRQHPTWGSAPNFVPPLFCLYLIGAIVWRDWLLWPLAFYALAVITQALGLNTGSLPHRLAAIPLIFLTHVLYGAGFLRGLIGQLKSVRQPSTTPVTLDTFPAP